MVDYCEPHEYEGLVKLLAELFYKRKFKKLRALYVELDSDQKRLTISSKISQNRRKDNFAAAAENELAYRLHMFCVMIITFFEEAGKEF